MPGSDPPGDPGQPSGFWGDAPCGLLRLDPDGLILAANPTFLRTVGYADTALVGHLLWRDLLSVGSRLLFETQLAPILQLDGALHEVLLELRDSAGARIPVLMNAERRHDGRTDIAVMTVSDRKAYEDELRRARDDAERARAADSHTRSRLLLLSRANEALASSMHIDLALHRLARVLVDEVADWCVIYALDRDESFTVPATRSAAHADPELRPVVEQLAAVLAAHTRSGSDLLAMDSAGAPVLRTGLTDADRWSATGSDEVVRLCRTLGVNSTIVAPVRTRGHHVATLILARGNGRPGFADSDLADITDLTSRTGIVVDNLYRHAREHNNSVALQQALLTEPPRTPTLEIATRYLPSESGNEIGGDWYDVFLQRDGTPVLVIGDVIGHDIHAAAAMGHLRGIIRTLGFAASASPAEILANADAAARGLGVGTIASALVARIEVRESGTTLRWSSAGHLPPLLLSADGTVKLLDPKSQILLGIDPGVTRQDHTESIDSGDWLVLYTDGLVERVHESIDDGLARLAATVTRHDAKSSEQLCDRIIAENGGDGRDDIALLVARVR